jgi:hypothetical protein
MIHARMKPLHDVRLDRFTEQTAEAWLEGSAGDVGGRPLAASSRRRYPWLRNALISCATGRHIEADPPARSRSPQSPGAT